MEVVRQAVEWIAVLQRISPLLPIDWPLGPNGFVLLPTVSVLRLVSFAITLVGSADVE